MEVGIERFDPEKMENTKETRYFNQRRTNAAMNSQRFLQHLLGLYRIGNDEGPSIDSEIKNESPHP